jgi:hypothetical protein
MMRVRSFVACLAVALLATTFVGGGADARATVICKEKAGAECPCERSTKCSEKTELQASREKYEEAKEADKQKYEEDAERIYDKYCNPYSEKICGDWPNAKAKQELARAKDKYKERLAKEWTRFDGQQMALVAWTRKDVRYATNERAVSAGVSPGGCRAGARWSERQRRSRELGLQRSVAA